MEWEFVQRQVQILADGIMERLDIALQQISDLIDSAYIKFDPPLADERRRYALLQAAATMRASSRLQFSMDARTDWVEATVSDAEKLLAEIERRDTERIAAAKGMTV